MKGSKDRVSADSLFGYKFVLFVARPNFLARKISRLVHVCHLWKDKIKECASMLRRLQQDTPQWFPNCRHHIKMTVFHIKVFTFPKLPETKLLPLCGNTTYLETETHKHFGFHGQVGNVNERSRMGYKQ